MNSDFGPLWVGCLLLGVVICMPVSAQPYQVQRDIPYAADSRIAHNIKTECPDLGSKISSFLVEFAQSKNISVQQIDSIDPSAAGRNLVVEILDAVSRGNAFVGHQKYMEVRAELFVDGVSQGEEIYHRDSMGGFGAGFKGSCSVLGRTSKALGKDLSAWLVEWEAKGAK